MADGRDNADKIFDMANDVIERAERKQKTISQNIARGMKYPVE